MKVFATYRKLDFSFPIREEPKWAPLIERWYQLDAFAYGLAEAYSSLRDPKEALPDFVYLASAGASNQTDFQFAQLGATSPSKFVHTLPNVRGSSLFQLMSYKGPLLCIQNDPCTFVTAAREALDRLATKREKIWIWSVSGNASYCVHWLALSLDGTVTGAEHTLVIEKTSTASREEEAVVSDSSFLTWLCDRAAGTFVLPGRYSGSHQIKS